MEACFTRWLRIGYEYARWSGLCPAASEDCAAEFLEHMQEESCKTSEAKTAVVNVLAWECTCARRFALNYRRGERRHEQTCDRQNLTDRVETGMSLICSRRPEEPFDFALRRDFHRQLPGHINALPALQREVFVRHHLHDEPVQEMADALNKTLGAVEQTLWRARQSLRQRLQEQDSTDSPPPHLADNRLTAHLQKNFCKCFQCSVRLRLFDVSLQS